ncbi:hypothetical protein SDC9_140243 [bioreactor metagenome]|uniref:Uncharacterized protein n=1 Tax=bioreactor metagenome TaxID=1076179 RepID=A0A645DUP6_9ZZZZ
MLQSALHPFIKRLEPWAHAGEQEAAAVWAPFRYRLALPAGGTAERTAALLPAHRGAAAFTAQSLAALFTEELPRVAFSVKQPQGPLSLAPRRGGLSDKRLAYRQGVFQRLKFGCERIFKADEYYPPVVFLFAAHGFGAQEPLRGGHRTAKDEACPREGRAHTEQASEVKDRVALRAPATLVFFVHRYRGESRKRHEGGPRRAYDKTELPQPRALPHLPLRGRRNGPKPSLFPQPLRQRVPEGPRELDLGEEHERRALSRDYFPVIFIAAKEIGAVNVVGGKFCFRPLRLW